MIKWMMIFQNLGIQLCKMGFVAFSQLGALGSFLVSIVAQKNSSARVETSRLFYTANHIIIMTTYQSQNKVHNDYSVEVSNMQ